MITYSLEDGVKMAWFGDLETEFMEKIADKISCPKVDILFAPHHGRDSGKIPASILDQMDPKIVVIGEAPSKDLNYYRGYNTITQNSAGTIYFECVANWVHIYVGSSTYSVDFLEDKEASTYNYYIGSLSLYDGGEIKWCNLATARVASEYSPEVIQRAQNESEKMMTGSQVAEAQRLARLCRLKTKE